MNKEREDQLPCLSWNKEMMTCLHHKRPSRSSLRRLVELIKEPLLLDGSGHRPSSVVGVVVDELGVVVDISH